jgi:amino acid transporter
LGENDQPGLQRHFGLLQATALNITMIVGAGVFITIPLMLKALPGSFALLGWLLAGGVMLFDGLVWSELGAAFPGSGGSYLYLLECYGRNTWGRLMAFLFIWQFLISGPLEIGSGLIAIALFSKSLHSALGQSWLTWTFSTGSALGDLKASLGPSQLLAFGLGLGILALLYRRIMFLGKVTITFWLGVLLVLAWILVDGLLHFQSSVAFESHGAVEQLRQGEKGLAERIGEAMRLAMYCYLGYYNVCYIGDEVRNPGRTIPRAIFLSASVVCVLFIGVHLAMLGTVPWSEATMENLPAAFMERLHGKWAAVLISLLLIWSCIGSAFAGLLGYSRIPFGAARYGHFFSPLGRVHAVHRIPHISLLVVGALSLFWTFFDLADVITALITTRIIEQFVGQIVGLVLLRSRHPERLGPYKMWLYPVPCAVALAGWLFMYVTAPPLFIGLGLATLVVGAGAFFLWSWRGHSWPFRAGTR